MNPSGRRVLYRAVQSFPLIAVMASIGAPSLTGQTSIPVRDGSLANVEPYLYAAEDFGIDPAGVTYHKDIAPILRVNCVKCHRPGSTTELPRVILPMRRTAPWPSVSRARRQPTTRPAAYHGNSGSPTWC
jgi:hypothetical protein